MNNAIDINDLNPQQIKDLRKQLRAASSVTKESLAKRNTLIDTMLHEKDGDEFKNTTSDILVALQDADCVPATLDNHNRKEWLKKIQTRKQHLAKKGDTSVGYKTTPTGIGALTPERVVDWIIEHSDELTDTERKGILAAMK